MTADYLRRIRKSCPAEMIEVRPATGRSLRGATRSERESRSALALVGPRETLVALDAGGAAMTSEQFARWLDRALQAGPAVSFVVGGAEGLSDALRRRADLLLSLSSLTLPHALARAVLTEQIYRAFSIFRGAPYHR